MMNRMKHPEPFFLVKEPMRPILRDVRAKERQDQLRDKWQGPDFGLKRLETKTTKQNRRRRLRDNAEDLHKQMADGEVGEIRPPFLVQRFLLRFLREYRFDRNKNHR